jgi:hypothetical protein
MPEFKVGDLVFVRDDAPYPAAWEISSAKGKLALVLKHIHFSMYSQTVEILVAGGRVFRFRPEDLEAIREEK